MRTPKRSSKLPAATISVAIVSKGRPRILAETVESLSGQTLQPRQIVIVVPTPEDLPKVVVWQKNIEIITGFLGSTVQRNRAIAAVPASTTYLAFFDDDVELSPDYLECAVAFMDKNPGVMGISGRLLANGRISRGKARKLIEEYEPRRDFRATFCSRGKHHILHGCNMVIRRSVLEYEKFDENLPFYSYGEDYDISIRLKYYGLVGKFAGCVGVHLETPSGRIHEYHRGYSYVANNFYFLRKKTVHLPLPLAWLRFWTICVGSALANGAWNFLRGDRSKDWVSQIKGILLGARDIFIGKCHPNRIKEI